MLPPRARVRWSPSPIWRWAALSATLVLSGCRGCDESPSAQVTASASVTAAPVLPPVELREVASTTLAAWPKQTTPLSQEQTALLLPLTEGARIALHDDGLAPREIRRHQLVAGGTHTLLLEVTLGMHVEQDGETTIPSVPALRVSVDLLTKAVNDGVAEVQMTIAKAEIRTHGADEIDEDIRLQLGPLVAKLTGIAATWSVTPQGVRENPPEAPKDLPTELRQLWTSIGEGISDAVMVFPTAAIGPGASWTVRDRQRRAGVVMLRQSKVTLLDITDGHLRFSSEVMELAIGGTARDPALPKDVTLVVRDGVTVGKRRHTLRVGQLWPLACSTELSSDLELAATARAAGASDTRVSKVKLTQILESVRSDVASEVPPSIPPSSLPPTAVPPGEAPPPSPSSAP